jgi:hypothetical protein
MRIQPEKLFQGEKCHKQACRRIKNSRIRLAKKNIQISIDQLRDREQIIPEHVYKSDIIQGEMVIYLDDAGTKHLTLLVIPKSYILLV